MQATSNEAVDISLKSSDSWVPRLNVCYLGSPIIVKYEGTLYLTAFYSIAQRIGLEFAV